MNKCIYTVIIICILTSIQGIAEEFPFSPSTKESFESIEPAHKQKFLYTTVSVAYGVGASFRTRSGHHGYSWDSRFITLFPLPLIGIGIDYNHYYYFKERGCSWYFSGGLGATGGLLLGVPAAAPYIPIRFGRQFTKGILDVGIQVFIIKLKRNPIPVPIPVPEIRLGCDF